MKIINQIVSGIMLAAMLVACNQEQEVAPVDDPSDNALITIARTDGGPSVVTEGDTMEFEIKSSKMLKSAIDFSSVLSDAAEADESDFVVDGGVLAPFTTSTKMQVYVLDDNFPEFGEALTFDIGAFDIAQNWRLSPESDVEAINVEVQNVNMEGVITIALNWPNHDNDLDFYIVNTQDENWGGSASAGSSIPEINTNLWPIDPNGTYYVEMDPYHLEGTSTPYTVHVGLEDGTVHIFEGIFDLNNTEAYEMGVAGYRLLSVKINNGVITVTNLAP